MSFNGTGNKSLYNSISEIPRQPFLVLPLFFMVFTIFQVFSPSLIAANEDSREMRTLKLRIKEAQLAVSEAEAQLNKSEAALKEAKDLFEQGLYTKSELNASEELYYTANLGHQRAIIALEKTRLAFLEDASHVTLEKAVLYRDLEGKKHVSVTLRNTSNTGKIIDNSNQYTEAEKKALVQINNLKVRLLVDEKLVGRPFEQVIPKLFHRQSKTLDFFLQRDTDVVTVQMNYGDSTVKYPVFLETEAREDKVIVEALQFSQEGSLGSRIFYELALERLAEENKTFSLELVNIPSEYSYEFIQKNPENQGENRVSRIRFKKGATQQNLSLAVNVPRELDEEKLNEKIGFYVLVLDRFANQRLGKLKAESQGFELTTAQLDSSHLSYEALELVPRGRAELELSSSNLFHKVKMNEVVKFQFKLENTGTVPLERVRVNLDLPLDWSASIKPEKNITIDVAGSQMVNVELIPPTDVVVGDYEVELHAIATHEGREILAPAKNFRIQLEGKSNLLLGIFLLLVLVSAVVGVAIMTVKISRR